MQQPTRPTPEQWEKMSKSEKLEAIRKNEQWNQHIRSNRAQMISRLKPIIEAIDAERTTDQNYYFWRNVGRTLLADLDMYRDTMPDNAITYYYEIGQQLNDRLRFGFIPADDQYFNFSAWLADRREWLKSHYASMIEKQNKVKA